MKRPNVDTSRTGSGAEPAWSRSRRANSVRLPAAYALKEARKYGNPTLCASYCMRTTTPARDTWNASQGSAHPTASLKAAAWSRSSSIDIVLTARQRIIGKKTMFTRPSRDESHRRSGVRSGR